MTRMCFVDVETTGLDPNRHHLWEIGLVIRDYRNDPASTADTWTDTEYCWQIRPDLTTADPMALKIGGYYTRAELEVGDPHIGAGYRFIHPDMTGEAPLAPEIAAELAVLFANAVLAAANVSFDAAFLAKFLYTNGQAPAWDYHLLEIESYAAGSLGQLPPWKLDRLAAALGVALPENRHSALADARLARDVFDAARRLRA